MTELNDIVTSLDDDPIPLDAVTDETEEDEQELSDTGPDSEPQTEENGEEAKKPNKLQGRLDKLVADRYAETQRADTAERRLKELESKQVTALPDDLVAPVMPEDTWDAEAMKEYGKKQGEYYRKLAQFEARNALDSNRNEQNKALKQTQVQQLGREFAERAKKANINSEQLINAGTSLFNAGLSEDLQMLIMEDAAGPQITMHLAKNPDLAFELIGMSPTRAAVRLATEIKTAALSTKPKVSKTPDPLPTGKAGSMREQDEFERKYKGAKFL